MFENQSEKMNQIFNVLKSTIYVNIKRKKIKRYISKKAKFLQKNEEFKVTHNKFS